MGAKTMDDIEAGIANSLLSPLSREPDPLPEGWTWEDDIRCVSAVRLDGAYRVELTGPSGRWTLLVLRRGRWWSARQANGRSRGRFKTVEAAIAQVPEGR